MKVNMSLKGLKAEFIQGSIKKCSLSTLWRFKIEYGLLRCKKYSRHEKSRIRQDYFFWDEGVSCMMYKSLKRHLITRLSELEANKLLIIDFGSQYTQLIARRVRELGVFSIVISIDDFLNYKEIDEIFGIILSGGPNSVYKVKDHLVVKSLLNLNLPVLGICYGMHILIKALGGKVEKTTTENMVRLILN